MKPKILLLMLVLSLPFSTFAEEPSPDIRKKPVVILLERDPCLIVINSDTPTFALYDDGQVIYLDRTNEESWKYLSVTLEKVDLAKLQASLSVNNELAELDDYYEVSDWTDQTTNEIIFWLNGDLRKVEVYGDLRSDEESRAKTPKAFLSVYDTLIAYTHEQASEWKPKNIEVMIWPYDNSPEEPLDWPADWPDTTHPETKQRDDSYSIYLNSEFSDALSNLLSKLTEKQALLINGKKWAVSTRPPFPNEKLWMK